MGKARDALQISRSQLNVTRRLWNDCSMSDGEQSAIQREDVEVVLHEYDTLRNEVLSRASARLELLGLLSIAATLFGVSGFSEHWRWAYVVGIALLILIGLWFYFGWAMKRCARRLRQIEGEVNTAIGRTVLRWESDLPQKGLSSLIR